MAGPASTIFRNPRASQKSKEKDALFVDQLPIHDHRWRFVTREIVFLESQSHNETLNFCYTNTITYTAWGGPIVTVCLWSTNKLQSGSIVVLHDSFILVGGKQFCVRNTQVQLGFDSNLEVHEPTEKKTSSAEQQQKKTQTPLCALRQTTTTKLTIVFFFVQLALLSDKTAALLLLLLLCWKTAFLASTCQRTHTHKRTLFCRLM